MFSSLISYFLPHGIVAGSVSKDLKKSCYLLNYYCAWDSPGFFNNNWDSVEKLHKSKQGAVMVINGKLLERYISFFPVFTNLSLWTNGHFLVYQTTDWNIPEHSQQASVM